MIIVRCAKTVDACDWLSLVYRNEADTTLGGILISVSKLVREVQRLDVGVALPRRRQ